MEVRFLARVVENVLIDSAFIFPLGLFLAIIFFKFITWFWNKFASILQLFFAENANRLAYLGYFLELLDVLFMIYGPVIQVFYRIILSLFLSLHAFIVNYFYFMFIVAPSLVLLFLAPSSQNRFYNGAFLVFVFAENLFGIVDAAALSLGSCRENLSGE